MTPTTVVVELMKNTPRRIPGRRPQPWRWLVRAAANWFTIEKSSEAYSNRGDAISAIELVHSPDTTVILREHGQPDRTLRAPGPRRIDLTDEQVERVMALTGDRITNAPFANRHALHQTIEILNEVIA